MKFKRECESAFLNKLWSEAEEPLIEIIDKSENLYHIEYALPLVLNNQTKYVLQQFRKTAVPDSENTDGWKTGSDGFIISMEISADDNKEKIAKCLEKMKLYVFDDDDQSPFDVDYIHCFMKLGPPRFINTTTTSTTTTTITTTTTTTTLTTTKTTIGTSTTTTTTTTTSTTTAATSSNQAYILDGHDPIERLWVLNTFGLFELQTAITFDCPLKFSSTFNHQDNIIIVSNYCSFVYFFDSDCGLSETSIPVPFPNKDNDDQMTSHTISDEKFIFAHDNGEIRSLLITDFPVSSTSWAAVTPIGPVLESRGKSFNN